MQRADYSKARWMTRGARARTTKHVDVRPAGTVPMHGIILPAPLQFEYFSSNDHLCTITISQAPKSWVAPRLQYVNLSSMVRSSQGNSTQCTLSLWWLAPYAYLFLAYQNNRNWFSQFKGGDLLPEEHVIWRKPLLPRRYLDLSLNTAKRVDYTDRA